MCSPRALDAFARYGYRKTSMEDVARAAAISRAGLYLLFGSKRGLFTAADTQALDRALLRPPALPATATLSRTTLPIGFCLPGPLCPRCPRLTTPGCPCRFGYATATAR